MQSENLSTKLRSSNEGGRCTDRNSSLNRVGTMNAADEQVIVRVRMCDVGNQYRGGVEHRCRTSLTVQYR